jgi:pimeloyl-ACP methyl ester carboxylesterase
MRPSVACGTGQNGLVRGGRVVVALMLVGACSSEAGSSPSAPLPSVSAAAQSQVLTFTAADGTAIDYVLLVPGGRVVGEPGKVLFTFPPGGQDLDLTQRIVDERWRDEALVRGWVVASPAAPQTGLFYNDASARLVPELLDAVAVDYPPDDGRFDLAGVSNGGLSAFKAALSFPERFRSLVVFPGYSPAGGDDPQLESLREVGVSMFVGANDAGWLDASRLTEQTLTALGYTVELNVVAGEGHIIESLTGVDLFDAIERVRR